MASASLKRKTSPSRTAPPRKKHQSEGNQEREGRKNRGGSIHSKKRPTSDTPARDRKPVQRKRPVTFTEDKSADIDSAHSDDENGTDLGDGDDAISRGTNSGSLMGEDIEGKEAKHVPKEGSTARESHKAQKALLSERRAAKQHSDVLAAAKPIWAKASRKDASKEERCRDVAALMAIVRGRIQDVVLKHDASRIVQTIVKYGSQGERDEIAQELKGRYRELAQNKYSKFLVTKLIRTSRRHRTDILMEFRGHVVRLLLHREASGVIADAFELYANAYERALLLHDFYGKEVVLFQPALHKGAAAGKEERDELKGGLAEALNGADNERRKRVLTAMKENLDLILNNSDKGAISHSIFHRALWEFLEQVCNLTDEEAQEKFRREIFDGCKDLFAEMVHTKDGSRVVREFLARGSAKDRKQILKTLKPHIERICKNEEAQVVLFTALDVIDDTKLTSKTIVDEITSHAASLYDTVQGRRALLYLLVPRSSRHFTPALSREIAETDPLRAQTSKKDPVLREEEVRQAASGPLLALLSDLERLEELIRDPGGSILVIEIMLYAVGDKSAAMKSLLQLLKRPYPAPEGSPPHLIDVPHSCRVYKTLLQGGHYSQHVKSIEQVAPSIFSPSSLASLWLNTLDPEETQRFGKGGGAFVVAALVERVVVDGTKEDKAMLSKWLDEQYRKDIEEGRTKGKQVLLDAFARM